jgi:hypothetical protein
MQLKPIYFGGRRYGRSPPIFQPTVSMQAFVRLEKMRAEKTIANWYEVQKNLFTSVIREYIVNNLAST